MSMGASFPWQHPQLFQQQGLTVPRACMMMRQASDWEQYSVLEVDEPCDVGTVHILTSFACAANRKHIIYQTQNFVQWLSC